MEKKENPAGGRGECDSKIVIWPKNHSTHRPTFPRRSSQGCTCVHGKPKCPTCLAWHRAITGTLAARDSLREVTS